MKTKESIVCENILKEHKYRLTPGRINLLVFLKQSKNPFTAKDIHKEMGHTLDKVTLYRALEDFSRSKIVAKVNLKDTSTYYEFLHEDHHHHHIVCEKCGTIEDIEHCNQTALQKEVIKSSKKFKAINSHSLEFFGVCKMCTK